MPGLTILVPTYRRPGNLSKVLSAFTHILTTQNRTDVSILVSDNASGDATRDVVARFARNYPNLSYSVHSPGYPTGEENIFFALEKVKTEYVWFFSDDDLPDARGVQVALEIVQEAHFDFVQFNCRYQSAEGEVFVPALIPPTGAPFYATTIDRIVAMHGFMHLTACFSSSMMRTDLIKGVDLAKYAGISPIYAHVAAYLEAFSGRPALFVAEPCFSYTFGMDFEEGGLWKFHELAGRNQTYFGFFWSLGLVRLLASLERSGHLRSGYLHAIVEVHHQGAFSLADRILIAVIDQILEDLTSAPDRARFDLAALDELALEYALGDMRFVEFFARLRAVLEVQEHFRPAAEAGDFSRVEALLPREQLGQVRIIVDEWVRNELQQLKMKALRTPRPARALQDYGGYAILDYGFAFQAVNRALPRYDPQVLGATEFASDLMLAPSLKDLERRIDAAAPEDRTRALRRLGGQDAGKA